MNKKILVSALLAVGMAVIAASPASALYFSDLTGDLLTFDGTSDQVKIDFNKGGSDIRDDGNLWINTDDSVFFNASTSVVLRSGALEFWPNMTKPMIDFKKGSSQIYDDGDLFIVTDDNIYLQGTTIAKGTVRPDKDDTYDLGSSTKEWKDLYVDGTAYLDDLSVSGTITGAITASGNLLPSTDSTYNLGSATKAWATGYMDDIMLFYGETIANTVDGTIAVTADSTAFSGDVTVSGGELYITPVVSSASTTEGTVYYDSSDDNLYVYTGSSFEDLTAGASGTASFDDIYNAESGEHTIVGDDGSMSWDMSSTYDFIVDIQGSGDFVVQDAGTAVFTVADGGAATHVGALTVGENDTGHDVKFFGATSGDYFLWDESANLLRVEGSVGTDALYVSAGNTNLIGTVTVGVTDTGHDVKFWGATAGDYFLWDESANLLRVEGSVGTDALYVSAGNTNLIGTVTVGVTDTGHDVKFWGATAGDYFLWDESANLLKVEGSTGTDALNVSAGNTVLAGNLSVEFTSNLDEVDIDGKVQIDETVTVGVTDTGHDVKFWGATAGDYMLWDESANLLKVEGSTGTDALQVSAGNTNIDGLLDVDLTANLDEVDIDGKVQADATITVGVDNTGYDVKFFGATTGKYWLWDESGDDMIVVGDVLVGATSNAIANGSFAMNNDDLYVHGMLGVNADAYFDGTVDVGLDNTGYDVTFWGATSGKKFFWDESGDDLFVLGNSFLGAASASIANSSFVTTSNNEVYVHGMLGVNGASYFDSTIDVGLTDVGYDVTFWGATAGDYMLWDESANLLKVEGSTGTDALQVSAGNTNIDGLLDVDLTANLDEVDIDGKVQIDETVTVGVDNTGYDVTFYGATASSYMLWDEDVNKLIVAGSAGTDGLNVSGGNTVLAGSLSVEFTANLDEVAVAGNATFAKNIDVDGTSNLDEVTIVGATSLTGALTMTGDIALTGNLDVDYTANLDEVAVDGNATFAKNIDVDGTSNLDEVEIAGATNIVGAVGITGDVTVTGNLDVDYTANLDEVAVAGNATFAKNVDITGTSNLDEVDIDGATDIDGIVTFGTDGTGYSSTWYSDVAGDTMAWSDTASKLTITGSASGDALDVVDGDVYIQDVLKLGKQEAITLATGDQTVTVTASYLEVAGTTGTDIILSPTGAKEGDVLFIVSVDTVDTLELDGDTGTMKVEGGTDTAMLPYDGVIFIFDDANWIQMGKVPANQ